jgi:uncharacterized protein with WD repeat
MIDNKDIVFKFKKSYTISHNKDYFCCVGGSVNLYDVKNGELKVNFNDMKQPNFSDFTCDNRLIIKTAKGYYYIYDITSKTLINKLRPPKGVLGSTTNFAITPDNKFIIDFAYIFPICQLMIMEIETGEYMLYNLNGAKNCRVLFNESESKYYIVMTKSENVDDPATQYTDFYCFIYPFQELELQKMPVYSKMCFSQIDCNGGKFAIVGYTNVISIYDINAGAEEQLSYDKDGVLYHLKWSKNGRYIILAESRTIHIINVETKIRIKSYDVDYGCFAEFYDSDTKLLIGTWKEGYCININS